MGLFFVSHHLTQAEQETDKSRQELLEVNRELGLNWIRSYQSNDGLRIFSIYEAPDDVALRDQALCLGLPVSDLMPVSEVLPPRFGRCGQKS